MPGQGTERRRKPERDREYKNKHTVNIHEVTHPDYRLLHSEYERHKQKTNI